MKPGAISAKNIASKIGKSVRAIQKRAKKEGWPHFTAQTNGGAAPQYVIDKLPDDIRILIYKDTDQKTVQVTPDPPSHNKNAVAFGRATITPGRSAIVPEIIPGIPASKTPAATHQAGAEVAVSTATQPISAIQTIPPADPGGINSAQVITACAKADLLAIYTRQLTTAPHGRKMDIRNQFILAYNTGAAWPELFARIGPVASWKTIESWKSGIKSAGGDTFALADRRGYARRGATTLSPACTEILLRCALHPDRPRVAEAIRMARAVMRMRGISNGHSDSTYRRWLMDWRSLNYHIWVFSREGAKAWNDKCAFSIERDITLINVGDVLVADGHTLNFEILNPWTGKPKRMILILWYDMRSSRPCGWEIMPTENTAAIAAALRRAILFLGKIPKVAYLDNGKAFSSRFFNGADLEQSGFSGLFKRLNIKTIFAWPYHGQSKTIERFFATFAELERWCPTYTGTSINNKPPRMNRGERVHRQVYDKIMGQGCITLEQAHRAIAGWFDLYSQRPQTGHLAGAAPDDIFQPGRGPGVDAAELRYMMLAQAIKAINADGIRFLNRTYYAPELYGRRHPVRIRYDLQDPSSIIVEDPATGELICEAYPPEKCHPAASILGTDDDRARLSDQIRFKKSQEREASMMSRTLLETEILPEHRRLLENSGLSPDTHQTSAPSAIPLKSGRLLSPPSAIQTDDEILAGLETLRDMQGNLSSDPSDADVAADPGPEVVRDDETVEIWKKLTSMTDPERYESLIGLDVRGFLIPKHFRHFMTYFEQTPAYERDADYYEQRRAEIVTQYQVGN